MIYTLADLKVLVYARIENNTLLYPADEVTDAINEAVNVVNLFTGFLETSVLMFTQQNRIWYDVPEGILFPLAVIFNGTPLWKMTVPGIAQDDRDFMTRTTSTRGPVANWIPAGIRKFGIYPADSQGGQELSVEGVTDYQPMTADSDTVEMTDEFVSIITDYSEHILPLKETGKVFVDTASGYNRFQSKMKEKMRWQRYKFQRYWVSVKSPPETTEGSREYAS